MREAAFNCLLQGSISRTVGGLQIPGEDVLCASSHSNPKKLELQTPARQDWRQAEMAAISDSDDDIPPYSDLSSVSSDLSDRIRGNVFQRALYRVDRARGKTEDFLNDIHESYSFDLDPEYRLKLQKRFDGWGVGAKFDFKSGDCRVKVKSAPRRGGEDGFRFWRWFKKVEVQPEDGDVEVFTKKLQFGYLSLQGIGGYKSATNGFNARWKIETTFWESSPAMMALRRSEVALDPDERIKMALRWDLDVKPPKAEGGIGDGNDGGYDLDLGTYHVAIPRLELKVDLTSKDRL